ncbi:DUF1080 domain-containing protein [Sphingopyxis sp.]|jgi:hypothetical protein|uniref:3-keto-disaccharide hydrolase n=1 Tax=Sphingopyxis sp. TaxID=1908224 RepID=UPI002DF37DEE|nr:DUF1080 domain-containing protein [Sphingopyxis sp.]
MITRLLVSVILGGVAIAMPGAGHASPDASASVVAACADSKGERLILDHLPKRTGPKILLFNGKNLEDWEGWLGYGDPARTYRGPAGSPLGHEGADGVFKRVREDGKPAIYISGKTWGALTHKGDFGNYHLRLEFKWGEKRWPPSEGNPPNNGVMYHSHGNPGEIFGTWMKSVEFEMVPGSLGMALPIALNIRFNTSVAVDLSLPAPHYRFMEGGEDLVVAPMLNVKVAQNAERPHGEWNRLDLYVLGDKAIHVVNGVPVMMVRGIRTVDATGRAVPLTHGRIQLQSQGAETYFRSLVIEPIDALPTIRTIRDARDGTCARQ